MGYWYEGKLYNSLEDMKNEGSKKSDKSNTETMIDMIKDYLKDHTMYELMELLSVAIKEHEGY